MRAPGRQVVAATLVAATVATVYLLVEPRSADHAAHAFRAELIGREGFSVWNGLWYGGHHTPAYSALFPPLSLLLGPRLAGALAAVAAAALFAALAGRRSSLAAAVASGWFALAVSLWLFTGRLPFLAGVALGLGALLANQRGRPAVAATLGVACSLMSPVAGLFLALAGAAIAIDAALPSSRARRPGGGLALLAAGAVPCLLLAVAFPEGGAQPFPRSALWRIPLLAGAAIALVPRRERVLRIGAALYGAAGLAAFLVESPVGSNVVRLGALFGGPVLACALLARPATRWRVAALALLALPLGQWALAATIRDIRGSTGASARPGLHAPLNDFLAGVGGAPGRLEIPFTRTHWEAAEVAPRFPLARGWQRQLDQRHNGLFYDGSLDDARYAGWLSENGVRFVALAEVGLDYSAWREAELIRRGPSYLREVWRSPQWRVFEVTVPHPMVVPEAGARAQLTSLEGNGATLMVGRPGAAVVRVRWSPYWRARGACVERAGEWTRVIASQAGEVRLEIDFSLDRLVSRGRRCAGA